VSRNDRTVSENVDKFAEVIEPDFLQVQAFLVGRRSTVLLTGEQVERVLRTEKRIVVDNFHCRHPVWREITCDLQDIGMK